MNQAEQQLFLDDCEQAFLIFAGRNPQYEQTESNARRIAAELKALGLTPANAEHVQIAWDKLAQEAVPVPEPTDPIEAEARRLIANGTVTVESINSMTARQAERAARNAVMCKCIEILCPRKEPSLLTAGDLAQANGRANLAASQGKSSTTAEEIEKMEVWRREHFAKISTATVPASSTARGALNLNQSVHMPKSSMSQTQFDAAIRQEKEDHRLLEDAAAKSARRKRVMANKASR